MSTKPVSKIDIIVQHSKNDEVLFHIASAREEIYEGRWKVEGKWLRLRSCTADVCETENYYVLRSYRTIIACIEKKTDTLYDGLRVIYGYTSTSAQHISKFGKDYGKGKWGVTRVITAYDV